VLEVTCPKGKFHAHYHFLLVVPAQYLDANSPLYITQPERVAIWKKALQADEDRIIDIRVPPNEAEAIKYVGKPGRLPHVGRQRVALRHRSSGNAPLRAGAPAHDRLVAVMHGGKSSLMPDTMQCAAVRTYRFAPLATTKPRPAPTASTDAF